MIVIGIDIGLTGAVSLVDRNSAVVFDIPVRQVDPDAEPRVVKKSDGGKRMKNPARRIDGRALSNALLANWRPGIEALVIMEDVRVRPMTNGEEQFNSTSSQTSLMESRGIVFGIADMLRLQVKIVQPQTWKRHFGLLKMPKADSLVRARALFPSVAGDLKLVKHHNRAEALLIASYALERLT